MISYKPLQHTLIEKGVRKMELVKMVGMSNSTLNKLNKNQYVALEVVERICLALDCSIADVVEIKKTRTHKRPCFSLSKKSASWQTFSRK